jgi:hypothetical protein
VNFTRRRARVGRRAHQTADHEHVAAGDRDLRRCSDARLIVSIAIVEAYAGNDGDEILTRALHARDLLH